MNCNLLQEAVSLVRIEKWIGLYAYQKLFVFRLRPCPFNRIMVLVSPLRLVMIYLDIVCASYQQYKVLFISHVVPIRSQKSGVDYHSDNQAVILLITDLSCYFKFWSFQMGKTRSLFSPGHVHFSFQHHNWLACRNETPRWIPYWILHIKFLKYIC